MSSFLAGAAIYRSIMSLFRSCFLLQPHKKGAKSDTMIAVIGKKQMFVIFVCNEVSLETVDKMKAAVHERRVSHRIIL